MNKRKINILIIFIGFIFFSSCDNHPTIKITRDYIYNSRWLNTGSYNSTAVSFSKIKLNDKIKSKSIDKLSGFEIHNNILKDTTFSFATVPNRKNKSKYVYFNKIDDNVSWRNRYKITDVRDRLSQLELNTWYCFDTYLYEKWIYYVYVDEKGNTHLFPVNPVNI